MTEQAKVPAIRFAGFTDPWEQRKLGEIADKVTEKNLDGNITEVLTNSAEYGVINQTEFFDHAVAKESNIAGYYVIAPGDFVYNPRISATAPVGPIRRNTLGIHGVMSPLYTVFRLTDAVDGTYLSHFFKTNGWHGFMKLEGNSGARSDRFSIGDATFFEMPIPVPSSSEQYAIGSFFSRLDDLITLHQRKYDKLVIFKKSMLEKMFPKDGESVPEIRFAGFTDPWEQRKLENLASFGGGHTPSMADASNYVDGKILWVTSQDVKQHYIENTTTMISEKGAATLTLYPSDSIVIVARSGILRHTIPVAKLRKPATVNQDIKVIQTVDSCDSSWLLQYFIASNKTLLREYGKTGTTVESIDFAKMKSTALMVPYIEEQQAIGSFFSRLDNLITLHQRKLELLQDIKKSLLDKMFV
ncbi:restriction endonuclease subunit S [Bifidobacterium longum]|uniref:restriction endonuclease subunit S n=2 Tax=Bifidobacterium longum TaxID=216816 RepID=UPI00103D65D9|nr:restriction endonuclease subunit S [Bifidobacterium longum subsp. longum]TCE16970.1 restriction endonuclease S subunit [Bifidobacterium longum subsp. longum]